MPLKPVDRLPHSLSLPAPSVLESQPKHEGEGTYTRMKPQHELWKLVQSAVGEQGLEKLRHDASAKGALGVSLTCGSGMTACIVWLALQQLGIDGALYDESWAGWGRRAHAGEAPVEKSDA